MAQEETKNNIEEQANEQENGQEIVIGHRHKGGPQDPRIDYNDLLNKPDSVNDHGALDGLSDDDHPQYHNDTRGDKRYYTKPYTPEGTTAQLSDDTEVTGSESTYTKVKELTVSINGTIRVKFNLGRVSGTAYAKVYINDVAQGIERMEPALGYDVYSESFTVSAGDKVQLYARATDSGTYKVKNFRIYYENPDNAIELTYASDTQRIDDDEIIAWHYTSYTKIKEIQVKQAGKIRVKFDMRRTSGSGTGYGKIYVNGSAVGDEHSVISDWNTYSDDIEVEKDDLVQLYVYSSDGSSSVFESRNFRLYWDYSTKEYMDEEISNIESQLDGILESVALLTSFEGDDNKWDTYTAGSGTISFEIGKAHLYVDSGQPEIARFSSNDYLKLNNNYKTTLIIDFQFDTAGTTGTQANYAYITTLGEPGTGAYGFGFYIIRDTTSTRLYAYSRTDNTTSSVKTQITGVNITQNHRYKAVYTPQSNIKFYVDGVLKATHTTGLPTNGNYNYSGIAVELKNGSAESGPDRSWNLYIKRVAVLGRFKNL